MGGVSTRRVEWSASALSDTDWATSRIRWDASTSGRICVTTDMWAIWEGDVPSPERARWQRNTVVAPWARHGGNIANSVLRRIAVIKNIYLDQRDKYRSQSNILLRLFRPEEFKRLCPEGPGRDDTGIDLNECLFMPDACAGGECINTDGSFRCECPSGYMLDASGRRCVDNNECLSQQNICGNGTCTNIEGGFECSCNEGFTPGVNQICEDVNECLELGNQCAFRCHNAPGSFRCICPYGYTLAPDARHCIGLLSYPLFLLTSIISLEDECNFQLFSIVMYTYTIDSNALSLFQTWTSARPLRTIASTNARILSAPSCASAHLDTNRSVWPTSVKTSTNARLIQVCAEMANAWTWRVVISVSATTGSSRVRMESLA